MSTATDRPQPSSRAVGLQDRAVGPRRRMVLGIAVAIGLAGPTAVAFFSGGYFAPARAWAGLLAWALAAVGVALASRPLPAARCGRV
ncbi:MAG: hypothetical protein ACYC0H_06800, partial [Solirubrobacteraceae bacterium]